MEVFRILNYYLTLFLLRSKKPLEKQCALSSVVIYYSYNLIKSTKVRPKDINVFEVSLSRYRAYQGSISI